MSIIYNDIKKDLPCEQIQKLFVSAGWSDGSLTPFMNKPFINSTLVISAWENENLIGIVRVLSDKIIRSVIYDLVVLPDYHNKGIGKELVKRCIEHFPNSEWLIQTESHIAGYYEKMGFKIHNGVVLTIPPKSSKHEYDELF
jgi:predicted N-acetyltransferase YhbS